MRKAFINKLIESARQDNRIVLLVGDVGYGLVEPFKAEFPDRFINTGIAEQNMIGIAAGLALSGKVVFLYSLANFPTLRCLEQIRNDLCYHRANVKIVSAGGGLVYGALGITHQVTEDLAIMRSLPEISIIAPGDPVEAGLATEAILQVEGPCYLRLSKTGDKIVYDTIPNLQIGKAITVKNGNDISIISTGSILPVVLDVASKLEKYNISARVISMHTLKPLDTAIISTAIKETKAIITVEEHSIIGGLGGAVAEYIAENDNTRIPFKRIGINGIFCRQIGSQEYLRSINSLSADGITATIIELINRGRR